MDSNSDLQYIYNHLAGLTDEIPQEPDPDKQYIFHFIYYLDVWYGCSMYMEEVGWVGWVNHTPTTYKRYQAPEFEFIGGYDFEYWDDNPWGISVPQGYRDDYQNAEDEGDMI